MKKMLLFLLLSAVSLNLSAQKSIRNWEKTAGSAGTGYSWFVTTGTNINSCAYNPITDKLYVANRQTGIYIINPADGTITGSLNITGITLAGSLAFHKIRVTSTGEIFAASLKTSTGSGNTFVYYWASEASTPILLGNASTGIALASERAADAFAVTGSGQNVVMYFGGSGTSNLQVVNKNGLGTTDFIKINNITLPAASAARSSIAPVTTGITSDIWVSGAAVQKRLITSAGVVTKAVADNLLVAGVYTSLNSISNKFASLEYFEIDSKKFLAASGAHDATTVTGEGLILHIYDVTDVNNVKLVETTKLSNTYNANTTPGTDIAIKKVLNGNGTYTITFFQLINHNGLASYTLNFASDGTLPVSLTSFTASLKNSTNTLSWATASESNNSGFEIESSLNGTDFNKIGFLASKGVSGNSTTTLSYIYEDAKAAKGVTYYRLKQIDLNGAFEYSDVKAIDNKLSKTADFTIYPNPVVNYINVATSIENLNGYQYELYNSNGVKVKTQNLLNDKVLDVSELAPSVYILKIVKDNNLVQSFRIVKQ